MARRVPLLPAMTNKTVCLFMHGGVTRKLSSCADGRTDVYYILWGTAASHKKKPPALAAVFGDVETIKELRFCVA